MGVNLPNHSYSKKLFCVAKLVALLHRKHTTMAFNNHRNKNHSYVDLTLVGEDISDPGNTVRCHSDLETCCTRDVGDHRGSWFFPDGSVLPFSLKMMMIL